MLRQLFTSAIAPAILSLCLFSCTKSGSDSGETGSDSTKGSSKIIIDTYLDKSVTLDQQPINLCLDGIGDLIMAEHGGLFKIDAATRKPAEITQGDDVTFPESLWFLNGKIYTGDVGTGKAIFVDGGGSVTEIPFQNPNNLFFDALGVVIDNSGNYIIADQGGGMFEILASNQQLVQIGARGANKVTDGPYASATFGEISAITEDEAGNIYIADSHRIRKLDGSSVTTVSGGNDLGHQDGPAKTATFGGAMTICSSGDGGLYIADFNSNRIRKMAADGSVTTIAGQDKQGYVDGPADVALFYNPSGIAYSATGHGIIYVSDYTNYTIRRITLP